MELDMRYGREWSLLSYAQVLLLPLPAVIRRRGVC